MANFVALFDACVLSPASVRDLLLRLALTDLFRARWTDRIHDEWIGGVLKRRRDLSKAQLERARDLMNQAVPDCLVTAYESLIDGLHLPDPDDRHVLAAAIRCQAGVIVTYNLKHFPEDALAPYGPFFNAGSRRSVDSALLIDQPRLPAVPVVRRQRKLTPRRHAELTPS